MDTATVIVMVVLVVILGAMVIFAYRALRGDWYIPEPQSVAGSRQETRPIDQNSRGTRRGDQTIAVVSDLDIELQPASGDFDQPGADSHRLAHSHR
jgi:hypothetical protein